MKSKLKHHDIFKDMTGEVMNDKGQFHNYYKTLRGSRKPWEDIFDAFE